MCLGAVAGSVIHPGVPRMGAVPYHGVRLGRGCAATVDVAGGALRAEPARHRASGMAPRMRNDTARVAPQFFLSL